MPLLDTEDLSRTVDGGPKFPAYDIPQVFRDHSEDLTDHIKMLETLQSNPDNIWSGIIVLEN